LSGISVIIVREEALIDLFTQATDTSTPTLQVTMGDATRMLDAASIEELCATRPLLQA
jgi:hypothetical protein